MIFKLIGEVTSGSRIGHGIGFPTANITIDPALPVADGVWVGTVTAQGRDYPAMINIGYSPTVGNRPRRLEANLFGFHGDLYGSTVEVKLLEFIRPEIKFGSLEELREQIEKDRTETENYFNTRFKDSEI